MATHGNGNGKNGNGEHHRVALSAEILEEKVVAVEESTVSSEDFDEVLAQREKFGIWVEPEPTMESIHHSLVDIHRELKSQVVPTLDRVEILTKMLAAGLESTSKHTNQVDGDVADVMLEVRGLRKDVQYLKDDVAEMKTHVVRIPVIIDMLGEILARLPDPSPSRRD